MARIWSKSFSDSLILCPTLASNVVIRPLDSKGWALICGALYLAIRGVKSVPGARVLADPRLDDVEEGNNSGVVGIGPVP